MKCSFCGKDFVFSRGGCVMNGKPFCSDKCRTRFKKGLFHLRPVHDNKSLSDWVREARECNLDYGTYRALRNLGKSFEELKATAANRQMPTHAHGRGRRYDS